MKRFIALLLLLSLLTLGASAQTTVLSVNHAPSHSKAPFIKAQTLEAPPFADEDVLLTVDFINIKIGDAILLRSQGQSMLIDGGTNDKVPRLKQFFDLEGITGFTYYLNTHAHDDHINAATRLVQTGYPAEAFFSKYSEATRVAEVTKLFDTLAKKGIPHRQLFPGDVIQLGAAEVSVFWNTAEGLGVNAQSMLVHVRAGGRSLLLPADVTGSSLGQVMELYPQFMDVDVMKSPHHGINRLRPEFYEAVTPEAVIITANMGNGETLAKQLRDNMLPHYYISMGTITLTTDGETWYISQADPL